MGLGCHAHHCPSNGPQRRKHMAAHATTGLKRTLAEDMGRGCHTTTARSAGHEDENGHGNPCHHWELNGPTLLEEIGKWAGVARPTARRTGPEEEEHVCSPCHHWESNEEDMDRGCHTTTARSAGHEEENGHGNPCLQHSKTPNIKNIKNIKNRSKNMKNQQKSIYKKKRK